MTNIIGSQSNKTKLRKNQNTIETLKDSRNSDLYDQFFGNYESGYQPDKEFDWPRETKKPIPRQRREFSIFDYQQYYEKEIIKKEIRQLTEQIKKELESIKTADASLLQEMKDVQRLTLESLPEIP